MILVDDGSTDGSEKICDDYARIDGRVKVIHQINKGVSSARNAGLDVADGKYIAFVDADDWIETDLFEVCIKAIEESRADILQHGMKKEVWKEGKIKYSVEKGITKVTGLLNKNDIKECINEQIKNMNVNVFSYIFKKEKINAIRFDTDMPYSEDYVFVMQALAEADTYYFIQNCGYHYNARLGSAAYRWQPKMVECYEKTFQMNRQFFKSIKVSDAEMNLLMAEIVVNSYASLIYNLCLPTCTLKMKEKMKILKDARGKFEFDIYKRLYKPNKKGLFERIKYSLSYIHLEICLIILGPLYCRRS